MFAILIKINHIYSQFKIVYLIINGKEEHSYLITRLTESLFFTLIITDSCIIFRS